MFTDEDANVWIFGYTSHGMNLCFASWRLGAIILSQRRNARKSTDAQPSLRACRRQNLTVRGIINRSRTFFSRKRQKIHPCCIEMLRGFFKKRGYSFKKKKSSLKTRKHSFKKRKSSFKKEEKFPQNKGILLQNEETSYRNEETSNRNEGISQPPGAYTKTGFH